MIKATLKQCYCCKKNKRLNEFGIVKVKYRGKKYMYSRNICKECTTEKHLEYRKANRKKINEKARNDYKNNKNPFKLRSNKWRKSNREKLREKWERYRRLNPEKYREKLSRQKEIKSNERSSLSSSYVKLLLKKRGFPEDMIQSNEFINLKRSLLTIKRKIYANKKVLSNATILRTWVT